MRPIVRIVRNMRIVRCAGACVRHPAPRLWRHAWQERGRPPRGPLSTDRQVASSAQQATHTGAVTTDTDFMSPHFWTRSWLLVSDWCYFFRSHCASAGMAGVKWEGAAERREEEVRSCSDWRRGGGGGEGRSVRGKDRRGGGREVHMWRRWAVWRKASSCKWGLKQGASPSEREVGRG